MATQIWPWFDKGKGFPNMTEDEMKRAMKAAIKEWMDEKYAAIGVWSVATLVALAVAALTYFVLQMHGWHRLP